MRHGQSGFQDRQADRPGRKDPGSVRKERGLADMESQGTEGCGSEGQGPEGPSRDQTGLDVRSPGDLGSKTWRTKFEN